MKCADCARFMPPLRQHMHCGLCKCPYDPSATFKTLHFERDCEKFIQITEAQREEKREEWKRILNPVIKTKESENEEGN